jgi:hypothetical protein
MSFSNLTFALPGRTYHRVRMRATRRLAMTLEKTRSNPA